jgi:lipoprotein-releasing system permease protein
VATLDSGHFQFDSTLALIHLEDARRLFRVDGPTGVRVRLTDMQRAPQLAAELARLIEPGLLVRDWSRQNRTWFAAVQVQKRMMFIIIVLIVAVAAFNLVSTLVMSVTEKQSEIAILRTLGASPASVMAMFIVRKGLIGAIGTALEVAMGLLISFNIGVIVASLERLFGVRFLDPSIYFIQALPSDPRVADVLSIAMISLTLALLATLYPSWRASRVRPAEALRYD